MARAATASVHERSHSRSFLSNLAKRVTWLWVRNSESGLYQAHSLSERRAELSRSETIVESRFTSTGLSAGFGLWRGFVSGGPREGRSFQRLQCRRIRSITVSSSMKLTIFISPPHTSSGLSAGFGHFNRYGPRLQALLARTNMPVSPMTPKLARQLDSCGFILYLLSKWRRRSMAASSGRLPARYDAVMTIHQLPIIATQARLSRRGKRWSASLPVSRRTPAAR